MTSVTDTNEQLTVADVPEGGGMTFVDQPPLLEARSVSHRFGSNTVLRDVSLAVSPRRVHALLGPNGAGKTTLVRILSGLLQPADGTVRIDGHDPASGSRAFRQLVGYIPSGDRTFYLRISGLENLIFFGRLHGLNRRTARERAIEALEAVGLTDAARRRVGEYSHGMQKRLSIGRALLTTPPLLLVDEATHDLDPEGAVRVRELIGQRAADGAAVIWVTQRLEEIRGFAQTVTVLRNGTVRFDGSVPALMEQAQARRFLLRLHADGVAIDHAGLTSLLGPIGVVEPVGDSEHLLLSLVDDAVLGDALSVFAAAGVSLLSCREEQSDIENAFIRLTQDDER